MIENRKIFYRKKFTNNVAPTREKNIKFFEEKSFFRYFIIILFHGTVKTVFLYSLFSK